MFKVCPGTKTTSTKVLTSPNKFALTPLSPLLNIPSFARFAIPLKKFAVFKSAITGLKKPIDKNTTIDDIINLYKPDFHTSEKFEKSTLNEFLKIIYIIP